MTQRRMLEQRLAGLDEIGEIMRGMKNLAFMETRKLGRLIDNQREVVRRIDEVAADFLSFHHGMLPAAGPSHRVCLVIGSRRGFCGDFNDRLAAGLQRELAGDGAAGTTVIAVGHRLCTRLVDRDLSAGLEGTDVIEEIPSVLRAVVTELASCQARHGVLALRVLYQQAGAAEPRAVQLLPSFAAHRDRAPGHAHAPLLNVQPGDFLLGLGEQYLFAFLHAVLYESLLAENERRMRHLDAALRHLEDRADEILRRVRALRQEEIIEEIEVILLNAVQLDDGGGPAAPGRRP